MYENCIDWVHVMQVFMVRAVCKTSWCERYARHHGAKGMQDDHHHHSASGIQHDHPHSASGIQDFGHHHSASGMKCDNNHHHASGIQHNHHRRVSILIVTFNTRSLT
jgi:hypothetical protein